LGGDKLSKLISQLTRDNLIDELILFGYIHGKLELTDFLKRVWDIDSMPSTDRRYSSATGDIWKHLVANDDWTYEYLFKTYLRITEETDEVFCKFLEQIVHPLVRNSDEVDGYVEIINKHLNRDGFKIEISEYMSGYPIYKVIKINSGVKSNVKNLIFAANGPKPEIVINDSVSNEIQIVSNESYCLIYDLPIGLSGLLWSELGTWWALKNKLDSPMKDVYKSLFERLNQSLDSPPEHLFFLVYYKTFYEKLKEKLPALIPQVYLHYDPYSLKQLNGKKRLSRQRMDFLILLSNHERIVIEIDGKQHYSDGDISSPKRYSEMVSADRDLRLKGYEVYRFGGYELQTGNADEIIIDFFNNLFSKYGLLEE
jgi:very-short-patch-repair endonuclease